MSAGIGTSTVLDALVSQLMQLGIFDRVNQHEPKIAPGDGITAAIWFNSGQPVRSSGLASTTVRLEFNLRLYTSMLAEPQDMIDPNLMQAFDTVIGVYSGEFTLANFGVTIREIDLLGSYGAGLSAQAGYVPQDNKLYRVVTITVPVIVNDAWDQAQ